MASDEPSSETIVFVRDMDELVRLRDWLAGFFARPARPGVVDDLVLMVSELVTNVLQHTSSRPTVTATVHPDTFTVVVHDDDPTLPRLMALDARRVGGNGLRIVDAWSTTWGTEALSGAGKHVWFTCRRW